MERRDLLKGLAGSLGLVLGGAATAPKLLQAEDLAPSTPAQLLPTPAKPLPEIKTFTPVEGELAGEFKLPKIVKLEDLRWASPWERERLAVEELLKFRKEFADKRTKIKPIEIPFAAQPTNMYVRSPLELSAADYPELSSMAADLRRATTQQSNSVIYGCNNVGEQFATKLYEELPQDFLLVRDLVRPNNKLGPNRVCSPLCLIDVCELTTAKLAELYCGMTEDLTKYLADYPREILSQLSDDPVPHDVFKLISPLRVCFTKEAYMLRAFAYVEVFGCYADSPEKVFDMLSTVAPSVMSRQVMETMPRITAETINAELVAKKKAAEQKLSTDPDFQLAVELMSKTFSYRMQELSSLPADRYKRVSAFLQQIQVQSGGLV